MDSTREASDVTGQTSQSKVREKRFFLKSE